MSKPIKNLDMHHGARSKIFQLAKERRKEETEAEKVLWEELRSKKLDGFKFRRQHPMAEFILDFYCHQVKMSVELDGGYHMKRGQQMNDENRTLHLKKIGVREIRFKNEDVLTNIEKVLAEIKVHLSDLKNNDEKSAAYTPEP